MGTENKTTTGRTCIPWTDKYDIFDNLAKPLVYPFITYSKADWAKERNYCRQINGGNDAWCYTGDPEWPSDYCEIPKCNPSMFLTGQNNRIQGF